MGIILITHDLGVVAETCDRVVVMYAGQVVEEALVTDLFKAPKHPYTLGLLNSVPGYHRSELEKGMDGKPRLRTIPGIVPNLLSLKGGCRFAERCFKATDQCRQEEPKLQAVAPDRLLRCFNPVPDNYQNSESAQIGQKNSQSLRREGLLEHG
jgi:peptide/nickel transport system ATP-binding protein